MGRFGTPPLSDFYSPTYEKPQHVFSFHEISKLFYTNIVDIKVIPKLCQNYSMFIMFRVTVPEFLFCSVYKVRVNSLFHMTLNSI